MFKIRQLLQFKKSIRRIQLETTQKQDIFRDLEAFMKVHPVRIGEGTRQKEQKPGNIFLFLTQKHMYATLAIIMTLLAGSGTAFAAESTLPGDPLYPVKVHVNENIRGALALGPQAKSEWEARKAERRLEEATELAAEGHLNIDAETILEARFDEHTEKLKEQINKLEENGNIEAAANLTSRLESVLEIHENILTKMDDDNDEDDEKEKNDIKPLLKELKNEVKEINKIRGKIEESIKTEVGPEAKVAAENRMKSSLKHIEEVEAYLNGKNVSATSSARVKLETAVKLHAEGKTELTAENYAKAFILFGEAQRLAQEAKVMVHVKSEIKVDERVNKVFEKIEAEGIELSDDAKLRLENRIEKRVDQKIEDRIEERRENREEERQEDREDEDSRGPKIEIKTNGSSNGIIHIR